MPTQAPFLAVLTLLSLSGLAHAEPPRLAADAPVASPDSSTHAGEVTATNPTEPSPVRRTWNAVGQVTGINVAVWTLDRYILGREWARISPDSWERNLQEGFVWDQDDFGTNQFAHPYHGSLYYNAARYHGFGYLGASLLTILGSLEWELFAETEYPSANDLANTSLGGIALGEVMHRLSLQVLDNRARGTQRIGRELLGAFLSPARGFNRLVAGESWRISSTTSERRAPPIRVSTRTGYLKLSDGDPMTHGSDQLFVQVSFLSGDPVYDVIREPFDAFQAAVQFNTNKEYQLISHAEVQATLATTPLASTEHSRLVLGLMQYFYYTNIQAYSIGAQSFSASLLYGREFSPGSGLRMGLHLRGVVLGSLSSEHSRSVGRDYDYGPGVDLALEATYQRGQWALASAQLDMAWMHTVNGSISNHLVSAGRFQVDVPVYRALGMGLGVVVFRRDSFYEEFDDTTQYASQFRAFISMH
ncbi:DUF3943 domain-containing protein [Hyalangium gracile]|uniref:DUF3943 domain-containing protein n=1 Tax=Hyalangium gracile TaxID=394092 RepID=UPI001CCE8E6E|nr:DUF3943 domain-containing protein [Hyalangium gracile]